MTAPADLHNAALALLKGITSVTVYDGDVPKSPPADTAGRVYPYVVLWTSGGRPAADRPLSGATDALTWTPQVTVAAGQTGWLLSAVHLVRGRLEGARLTPGSVLREDTSVSVTVQKDPDTAPPRFYLPLYYSTTA